LDFTKTKGKKKGDKKLGSKKKEKESGGSRYTSKGSDGPIDNFGLDLGTNDVSQQV
jgi:hypothetical protein